MAKRYLRQTRLGPCSFLRCAARRAIALESLESRQLLSAAPMAGFQPAADLHAPAFESGPEPVGFAVDKIVVDPVHTIDLPFSGRSGITTPVQAIKTPPASEAVDYLIPDWVMIPEVVFAGGKDPSTSTPSDGQTGIDFEQPEYQYPDPYDPELGHPETESTGPFNGAEGGLTPNLPPSPLENSDGEFGSYNGGADFTAADREAVEVLDMLASLQYVPGERREPGEVTTDLPSAESTSTTHEARPAANDKPAQPQPSDGGMVELSPTACVQVRETAPGEPLINIEQLLALPPQMDTARGNYQAFEIFSDESETVDLQSILDTSLVPSPLEPALPNGTTEQPGQELTESESGTLSGQTVGASASSLVATEGSSGYIGIRTLNTAGAIAIVVFASRAARVREEAQAVTPPSSAKWRVIGRA